MGFYNGNFCAIYISDEHITSRDESEGWSNVFILLWCSRLYWAFLFWLPADSDILKIHRTIHFDYFRHSDSSNYCCCFARNKTVWLRGGQIQTNKSYNFNGEYVYKYWQKDSHSFRYHDIWKSAQGSICYDVMKLAENVYIVTTHTKKAETNTHRNSFPLHSPPPTTHTFAQKPPPYIHTHPLTLFSPLSPVALMSRL